MLARKLLVGGVVGLLIGGLMPGCGDDSLPSPTSPTTLNPATSGNRAPEALGVIPVQDLNIGEPTLVNVAPYFWDPDGDKLTYGAMSSDPDAVTATVSGATVTLSAGMNPRPATITVTATDPGNLTATQPLRYRAQPVIYPVVWSKNGFDGESYEYKVNCSTNNYAVLKTCFLWRLTAVRVETPGGRIFDLEKDFNIQSYSGEVTRRWVLYGPAGAGFPASGNYTFRYYTGDTLEYEQVVAYTLRTVGFPTNVIWRREGNDLVVEWTPPSDGAPGMVGKVILFPDGGEIISQVYDWGTRSARLPDISLSDGTTGEVNVMIAFSDDALGGGGYAYSENVPLVW